MILINGCSFTAEAADNPTWPEGFSSKGIPKLNINEPLIHQPMNGFLNVAVGGSSNLVIRRKTFWYLYNDKLPQTPDYAIIQWSTIDRWDYPVFVDESRAKTFPRVNERQDWVNKINYMNNGTDILGYGKLFYENYYSYYGAVIEALENIYHTQKYLEEKNIPYKMITIGNLFDMNVSIKRLYDLQNPKNKESTGDYSTLKTNKTLFEKLEEFENSWFELNIIEQLLNKIDLTKFLFTDDVRISGFGGGIIEWFLNKNETLNGGKHHPSYEQHNRFFEEFLWPNLKDEINAIIK
jgi:hypothetical protein